MSPNVNAIEEENWIIIETFYWKEFQITIEGAWDVDRLNTHPNCFQVRWRKAGDDCWRHLYSSSLKRKPTHEEIMNRILDEEIRNSIHPSDKDSEFEALHHKIQAAALKKCFLEIGEIHKNRGVCPVCQLAWSIDGKKHDADCPIHKAFSILERLKAI